MLIDFAILSLFIITENRFSSLFVRFKAFDEEFVI